MTANSFGRFLMHSFLVDDKNEGLCTVQVVIPKVGKSAVQIPDVKGLFLGNRKGGIRNRVTFYPEILWLKQPRKLNLARRVVPENQHFCAFALLISHF